AELTKQARGWAQTHGGLYLRAKNVIARFDALHGTTTDTTEPGPGGLAEGRLVDPPLEAAMAEIRLAPLGTPERDERPLTPTQAHALLHLGLWVEASRSEYHGGIRAALEHWAIAYRKAGRHDVAARAENSLRRLDGLHGPAPDPPTAHPVAEKRGGIPDSWA